MSAQLTFEDKQAIFDETLPVKNGKYITKEPKYGDSIPKNILRRMGKVCRMGSRTALQTIEETDYKFDSVIVGSGYGDMSQCYKFLDQVIAYDEGSLTPTNFVNASPNILAGTIALGETIRGYNSTHFQKGTAFYSALFDATIQIEFGTSEKILVGGSDEISDYYYRIQELIKPFRKEAPSIDDFYTTEDAGFIPGEASVFVGLSKDKTAQSICEVKHLETKFSLGTKSISDWIPFFLAAANIDLSQIDTIITGESGCADDRENYIDFQSNFIDVNHYRFKHFFGESANAIGVATWLACFDMEHGKVPHHFVKSKGKETSKYYLLYNHYSGNYHQLILLEKV
jgi:3-oxoacyl-(acyl-carrier-protein) synthase